MTQVSELPVEGAIAVAPEPTRVLVPSPIGVLGLDLLEEQLTQLVIVPVGRDRKQYKNLSQLKPSERSDSLDEIVGRLSEYLAGARRRPEIGYDLRAIGLRGLTRRVLKETARIPYGRTRTYQQIAANCGRPDSYRQVLSILTANPLPLVVPCHRVVPTKGGPGSYVASPKKKEWLLKMEAKNRPHLT